MLNFQATWQLIGQPIIDHHGRVANIHWAQILAMVGIIIILINMYLMGTVVRLNHRHPQPSSARDCRIQRSYYLSEVAAMWTDVDCSC